MRPSKPLYTTSGGNSKNGTKRWVFQLNVLPRGRRQPQGLPKI